MTGPEGEKYHGWWGVTSVEPPKPAGVQRRLRRRQDGTPNDEMPVTTSIVTLTERSGRRHGHDHRVSLPVVEAMEQLAEMGMEEGLKAAMGQMDAILASPVTAA